MSLQQAIHWLEQGGGARVFKVGALLLTLLALSATVAYEQIHGPRTEETLRQADLRRFLANGQGFTTSVNYPQVHAVRERRGYLFDATERMSEVYHAPAHPLVIAVTLAILPEGLRDRLFTEIPDLPAGFGADGSWASVPVAAHITTPAQGLSYEIFRHRVLPTPKLKVSVREFDSLESTREALRADDAGIAVVPWWQESDDRFKALIIGSTGGEVAFGPTAQNLAAGDYPLALTLSLVFERARAQELRPWLRFCYSDEVS